MNEDMAKFSLEAGEIYGAIQNTSLKFDANGLTVNNGSITIKNKDGNKVISFDELGNLIVKGHIEATSGFFKGEINASSGSFKGEINANGGHIGGFTIENS
jgi:hypothetical protein